MNQKFLSDNVFQHTTPSQWHMPGWGGELQAFTALTGRTPSAWQYQESYFLIPLSKQLVQKEVCVKKYFICIYLLFMYKKILI